MGSTEHAGPIPAAERERFDREGLLVIRGALTPGDVAFYRGTLDQTYAAAVAGGYISDGASMHQLSAVANCPEAAGLVDHPATFR